MKSKLAVVKSCQRVPGLRTSVDGFQNTSGRITADRYSDRRRRHQGDDELGEQTKRPLRRRARLAPSPPDGSVRYRPDGDVDGDGHARIVGGAESELRECGGCRRVSVRPRASPRPT